jgi:hypothetical protein
MKSWMLVALALLHATSAREPTWDRVLLLS